MKKLRITVNNTVYDVTVQVLEDDEQVVPGAGFVSVPAVQPPAAVGRVAAPPSTAGPAPTPRGPGDPDVIAAPLAGTVQKLFVQTGARVEAKTPVVMLDAMKMDTYIYAPRGGEVAEVCVAQGDAVQVGDVLIRFRAEA